MVVKGCGVLTASSRSEDHFYYTVMVFSQVESTTLSKDPISIQRAASSPITS